MKRFFPQFLAFALALPSVGAAAEPEIFTCVITKNGGFFADEMVFALDPEAGSAMVVDPLIMYYNDGRAREARITEATARKTVFNWQMPMTNMSGETAVMRFRAVLQRPSMRLLVFAQPAGYSTIFTGRGECTSAELQIEGL